MEQLESFYRNKKVLVTGGAGFIGSHLVQTLCSYGAHVTVIDDFSTGFLENLSCSMVTLFAHDITSYKACLKATKNQDIVFHTAALASVPQSIKEPALCEKINVGGTTNLLEACKANNVSTFIFSSSAAIYGEKNGICSEDDTPNPQSPYAESKLKGEQLCKENALHINTASLRYFNVYGPRQNPNGQYAGVVAKFQHNLLKKAPIIIYGDGQQKRDFIPVEEVVNANLIIGTMKNIKGDVFNIATGNSITLIEMLKKLEESTQKKPVKVVFKPAREGDIFYSVANCKKYQLLKEQNFAHN